MGTFDTALMKLYRTRRSGINADLPRFGMKWAPVCRIGIKNACNIDRVKEFRFFDRCAIWDSAAGGI
jgi:hypothetical protein